MSEECREVLGVFSGELTAMSPRAPPEETIAAGGGVLFPPAGGAGCTARSAAPTTGFLRTRVIQLQCTRCRDLCCRS